MGSLKHKFAEIFGEKLVSVVVHTGDKLVASICVVKIVKWKIEGVKNSLALSLYFVLLQGYGSASLWYGPGSSFSLMRIRILLLIKLIRICDHSTTDPPKLHFGPPGLHWEHRGPLRLYLEPLNILNFNFNADPSGSFLTLMQIRIQLPKIMRIRIRNTATLGASTALHDSILSF
jgi:hypothetical protein